MVQEKTMLQKRQSIWSAIRVPLCSNYMMSVINKDMLKYAAEHDCEKLIRCVHAGAFMDFTDEDGNTALHHAVMGCQDNEECIAAGKNLGLDLAADEYLIDTDLTSQLKCTREAMKVINSEIAKWHQGLVDDLDALTMLCDEGFADPMAENNDGQTAIDLAFSKNPSIKKKLENQVEFLEEKKAQEEEEAAEGGACFGWCAWCGY